MSNPHVDTRPVLWGVGKFQLGESYRELIPEISGRARLEVIKAHSEEAVKIIRERLRHEHCDVIISASSNAAYLKGRLPLPIVTVRIGGFDIMDAMVKARRFTDRIGVVLHTTVPKDLRIFGETFSLDAQFRHYYAVQDLRGVMTELKALGIKAIVGTGSVVDMAESMGMKGFFVYTQDSVRLALEDALNLVSARQMERSRHTLLNTVLQNLSDGVLAVDSQGKLMAANPAAEKITRSALTGWLGKPLQELLPTLQLGKMAASGNTQTEQTGVVEVIGDRTVVVDRSPLFAADEHIGTVLTLHSPSYVERAFSKLRAHNQERTHAAKYTFDDIVAESPAMRTVVRRCTVLAEHSDATVLLTGPSGVGKELLAQGIHNSGARRRHPFIAVNCGAFTETLLESELFGYEEGAFTGARRSGKRGIFEAAHRGTIFLDEIAELPLLLQTRLLRVLQEREVTRVGGHAAIPVDVRVIAATHKDPGELMRQGLFREDLFYRISVLRISVPPLRDRPEDLAMLTRTLFAGALERVGLQGALERILETAGPVLRSHDWQGNVRELKNVAERAAMAYLEAGGRLSAAQFAALLDVPEGPLDGSGMDETDLVSVRQRKEKKYILHVLEQCSGNRDRAASVLGVSRTTLWRLLKRHGVV